jgi:hypothetical protein
MAIHAKLDLVNQQSDGRTLQGFQLREANCFPCQSLNPRSEIQIFAFNLSVALTHLMLVDFKVTLISPPIVGVIAADAKGLKQCFQRFEYLILAFAKYSGQYDIRRMINGIPEPALIGLVPTKDHGSSISASAQANSNLTAKFAAEFKV